MSDTYAEGDQSRAGSSNVICPEGHSVHATAGFCPICLTVIPDQGGRVWTSNDH